MNNLYLRKNYYEWIAMLLTNKEHPRSKYGKLIEKLHQIPYRYSIPMDENRECDGINLRDHFAYEKGIEYDDISEAFPEGRCSVLEMMAALSIKGAERMLSETEYEKLFWEMVENLGIDIYTNDNYNEMAVERIINDFLNRNYQPNGKGGLFYIPDVTEDMREQEIWCQLCWYLSNRGEE